jgi:hypothetical protein
MSGDIASLTLVTQELHSSLFPLVNLSSRSDLRDVVGHYAVDSIDQHLTDYCGIVDSLGSCEVDNEFVPSLMSIFGDAWVEPVDEQSQT